MTMLWQDLRLAGRTLRKSPGFTVVAMLTLALGIGVNLALFGILNEMVLRPKPVAQPHELRAVVPVDKSGQQASGLLYRPYFDAVEREGRLFEDVVGYAAFAPKLRTELGNEGIRAELVTGDYFPFLGVTPMLGRAFRPEEDRQAARSPVAVISHAFWRSYFGAAPDVLGKTVTLNDTPLEIVGVAPPGFVGLDCLDPPCLWAPANMESVLEKHSASYQIVGRLAEPKLAPAVEAHLTPIMVDVNRGLLASEFPELSLQGISHFVRIRLQPIGRGLLGTSGVRASIVRFLEFAGVATTLLLLIACANVAGLFVARALQRRQETATRIALGATRFDLMRQIICEGILIAAGGTIGAALAFSWVSRTIMSFAAWWPGPTLHLAPDGRVLLFAVAAVLAVGMGFSILPAFQASGFDPCVGLKDGQGTGRRKLWLRHGLVVTQVAGSLVLLCGATLCLRSMSKQLAVDLGYPHERLALAPLDLERIGCTEGTFEPRLAEIVRRVSLVPGVEQVCASPYQPLVSGVGVIDSDSFVPEGYSGTNVNVAIHNGIGPGLFSAMGIPLLRGREFPPEDIESGRFRTIVSKRFAQRFWPDQDPLGKRVYQFEVIGVVSDATLHRHDDWLEVEMFRVANQKRFLHPALLISTTGDAQRVLGAVRAVLGRIHPRLLDGEVRSLRDVLKHDLAFQHMAMRILAVLGALALVLAAVGTYGVMAYVVNSRTREIGIRVAVGATRGDVMRLVLSTGLRLGLVAAAIGVPLALGAAGFLRHHIAGVSPFDPISFVAVTACVLAILLAACWLPARRAARVDPMAALREE